jgi:predicted nucleotidyltransferase
VAKKRQNSIKWLFSNSLEKMNKRLEEVERNLEKIARSFVDYFEMPISDDQTSLIFQEYGEMCDLFKVKNNCSIENIPTYHKKLLDNCVERITEKYKNILAIYLVGSLGRGEYEEGYSDINIYVITEYKIDGIEKVAEDERINLKVFTKNQFLSEKQKKYRIIAKADGILLFGKNLVKKEEIPSAGMFLALKLNDDILDILKNNKKWLDENQNIKSSEIIKRSKFLAKRILDHIYGVAISNKPSFTASRKERVKKIKDVFSNKKTEEQVDVLVKISKNGVSDLNSFINIIDSFYPKVKEDIDKMFYIKNYLENKR